MLQRITSGIFFYFFIFLFFYFFIFLFFYFFIFLFFYFFIFLFFYFFIFLFFYFFIFFLFFYFFIFLFFYFFIFLFFYFFIFLFFYFFMIFQLTIDPTLVKPFSVTENLQSFPRVLSGTSLKFYLHFQLHNEAACCIQVILGDLLLQPE